MTRITTVLVSAIAFFGSRPLPGQTVSPLAVLSPGLHSQTLARAGEPAIRYAIFIPPTYSPSVRVPLVLALHYGGNPRGAGRGVIEILVRPALADLGAIMVAPDSLGGPWDTPENERAVNMLLDAVQARYSIDGKKTAVTGFSMGGAGAWHFAAKYPERFSAVVPVAGRPTASANGWRLPILAIHSRNDDVSPIAPTETRIAELRKAGVQAELITVTGITHYETHRFVDALGRALPWLREIWK
jgi:predicted peptidase